MILNDLLVIELASVLAGPLVGSFFSELGATVIKIENRSTGGDVTRNWKLPNEDEHSNTSAYYSSANYKKEVLFLDLKDPVDRKKLDEYLKMGDLLITNFKPGDARKLQVDYNEIRKFNPSIIYGEITGFGPKDSRIAYDVVLQAESGFMFMNGTPGSDPVKMPVALIDILAAHQLKEGLLLALLNKSRTKKGALVRVSLFDTAVSSLANQASNWLMAQHLPQPMGSLHPNIAPYGELFLSKDNKMLVLAIGSDKQFQTLCGLMQNEPLAKNAKFSSNPARVKNRSELFEIVGNFMRKYPREHLMNQLINNGIPAGSIRNMKEVFEIPEASALILRQTENDGKITERVKTVAFSIQYPES